MKFDNSIVNLNIISISIMKNNLITIIVIVSVLCLPVIGQGCTVCSRCKDCSADVLGDQYLDSIDALLQKKIEQLGYPEEINRTATSRNITYSIQYSSGLTIQLALALDNMQIQLLNYTFNQHSTTSSSQATAQVTSSGQRTSDGYFVITDLASNMQIAEITRFLSQIVQASMANFKLTAAEYTLSPATIYRLHYQILTFSFPLIETVYLQSLGNGAYQLLDSNYSQLQPPALKTIDPLAILNDVWLPRINSLIINQYSNFLGQRPSILSISQQEPYYQFRYQVAENNYTFFVMYDFIQNRIIHGNITITRRGDVVSGQTSAGTSTSATTSPTVSSSTTTTTSSQLNQSSSSSASNVRSASTGPASFLPSSQTVAASSQSSSSSQTFSSTYSDLPNAQSSQQVSSVVSYLRTLNIQFASSDIRSIKVKQVGSTIYYQLIIQLSKVPTTRTIFYQIEVTIDSNNKMNLSEANYANLDTPQLSVLTLEQITADTYIRQIAQFLLDKQYASLSADSRVVQIERDFPYYRFTFVNNQQAYVSIIALFNVYTQNIQVMSTNTQQRSNNITSNSQTSTPAPTPAPTPASTPTPTPTPTNRMSNTSSSQFQQFSTSTTIISNSSGSQNSQGGNQNTNSISQTLVQVPRANSSTSSSQSTQTIQQSTLVRVPQNSNQQNQPAGQTTTQNSQTTQTSTQIGGGLVPARQVTTSQSSEGLVPATKVVAQTTPQNSQQSTSANAATNLVKATQVNNSQGTSSQSISSSNQGVISSSQGASSLQTTSTQSIPSSTQQSSSNAQTSASGSSSFSSSSSSSSQAGFLRMSSESNAYYSYVVAGMRKVNGTFSQKGIPAGDIRYTDILYKVDQNILTVILKVEVQGKQYAFQYQGQINQSTDNQSQTISSSPQTNSNQGQSSTQTQQTSSNQAVNTRTTQSSTSTSIGQSSNNTPQQSSSSAASSSSNSRSTTTNQSSVSSSQVSSNSVSYEGAVYNRIPAQMAEQAYITLYLRYLTTTGSIYAMENLIGIYTNPMVPYSLLFRYYFNGQFQHILTTPTDIQQTLVRYYNQQNQKNSQQNSSSPSNNQNNPQVSTSISSSQSSQMTQQSQASSQRVQTISSSNSQTQNVQQHTQQTQQTQQVNLVTASNSNSNSRPQQGSSTSNPQQSQPQVTQPQQATQAAQSQNTQTSQSQQASSQRQQSTSTSSTSSSSSTRNSMVSVDPNCLCYDGARCMRCAHRYYLKNNQCISIPLQCLSYDLITGACYSCVPGYALTQGLCEPEVPVAYYFNNTCVTCFGNYKMVNRRCVYSPSYDPTSPNYMRQKNILCFAWQNNNCVQCIPGAYLSSRGICELVDPFCSIFDYVQEVCNTCEDGYSLRNGRCFKKQ